MIPTVPESFQRLVDNNGKFRVPTVFVTNAGSTLRCEKARQLTEWLGVKVCLFIYIAQELHALNLHYHQNHCVDSIP